MNDLLKKLQELEKRCRAILDAMFSRDAREPRSASPKTEMEYERQAQQLLRRARHVEGGLFYVVHSQQLVLRHFESAWRLYSISFARSSNS